MDQLINVSKLHQELVSAGLPVVSVRSTGEVQYSRLISKADELKAEAIINAHDPTEVPVPTSDQMIRALWKKIMLGDSKEADKILEMLK
jgi:type III secretory pathway component EscU